MRNLTAIYVCAGAAFGFAFVGAWALVSALIVSALVALTVAKGNTP